MIAVQVDVQGLGPILANLGTIERRAQIASPVLNLIANLLEQHVGAQFTTQGQQGGTPWRALRPRTVKARARRWGYYRRPPAPGVGAAFPVLVWSGRMRGSFRRGSPFHVRVITLRSLLWGTRVPYARYHQPVRPMIAFQTNFQARQLT
jgi:hypothetical protein